MSAQSAQSPTFTDDPQPRNFATVTNKIIDVIPHLSKDYKLECLNKTCLFGKWIYGNVEHQPHIIHIIYEKLIEKEQLDCMNWEEYQKFVNAIRKIQRDGLYVPPQGHYILWEKLARVCYHSLNKYRDTDWALQVSKIIRNID